MKKITAKHIFFTLIILLVFYFSARELYLRFPVIISANTHQLTAKEMVNNLDSMMGNYYKTKDILVIPTILQNLSGLNIMEFGKHKTAVTGFLTGVIKDDKNKDFVSEWKKLKISAKTKKAVDYASKSVEKSEKFLNEADYLETKESIDFYTGYFAATYDIRCIKLLVKTQNNGAVKPEVREQATNALDMLKNKYNVPSTIF